jgi:hypothetical protein
MTPRKTATALIAALLAVAFALPAAAQTEKSKKRIAKKHHAAVSQSTARGTNLFPAGPLYYAGVYLGDDPDPFIRLSLQRDISGRFGGDQ